MWNYSLSSLAPFIFLLLGKEGQSLLLTPFSPQLTTHDEVNFLLQKVLVRDLFCGEISNNVVSLVRKKIYIRDWILLVKASPNGKCFATKHDQTLFGDQTCWLSRVAKRCHVWTSTMFYNVWGNDSRRLRLSNAIKQGVQTGKRLVTKQVDRVWSPNFSRLDKALKCSKNNTLLTVRHCVHTLEIGESCTGVMCMVFL